MKERRATKNDRERATEENHDQENVEKEERTTA